mmetsp:Transcript_3229/g.9090  ORF Transcript_3229/g.9090 Transcript_3229/m.9090 type:complete len:217 (+) Transcript_3229:182-832(+)
MVWKASSPPPRPPPRIHSLARCQVVRSTSRGRIHLGWKNTPVARESRSMPRARRSATNASSSLTMAMCSTVSPVYSPSSHRCFSGTPPSRTSRRQGSRSFLYCALTSSGYTSSMRLPRSGKSKRKQSWCGSSPTGPRMKGAPLSVSPLKCCLCFLCSASRYTNSLSSNFLRFSTIDCVALCISSSRIRSRSIGLLMRKLELKCSIECTPDLGLCKS